MISRYFYFTINPLNFKILQTIAHRDSRPISEAGSSNLFLSAAWKSIITWNETLSSNQQSFFSETWKSSCYQSKTHEFIWNRLQEIYQNGKEIKLSPFSLWTSFWTSDQAGYHINTLIKERENSYHVNTRLYSFFFPLFIKG